MATNIEKMLAALIIIAIVVSAGNLFFLMRLTSMPDDLAAVRDELNALKSSLAQNELFPNETSLYAAAKTEGSLIIYVVWDTADIVPILAEFTKRYPAISTVYWQAKTPDIVARVLRELAGNQQSFDVSIGGTNCETLVAADAFTPYTSVQLDKLVYKETRMVPVQISFPVVIYNTGLMNASTAPKTWEDMVNPLYQDQIALGNPLTTGTQTSLSFSALKTYWNNNTKWEAYVRGVKALNPSMFDSSAVMERLVVSGEYTMAWPALLQDTVKDIATGAPVSYVQLDPAIIAGQYVGIYKLAPHPNTAKLFAEWIVTTEGQLAVASRSRTPNRVGVPSTVSAEALFPTVTKFIQAPPEYIANATNWMNTYVKPLWNP